MNISHIQYKTEFDLIIRKPSKQQFKMLHISLILIFVLIKFFLNQIKSSQMYNKIITVGIGDSTNDLEMLNNVDYACVVKSKNNSDLMKKIDSSKIVVSTNHAPNGWAECINNIFSQIKSKEHTYV